MRDILIPQIVKVSLDNLSQTLYLDDILELSSGKARDVAIAPLRGQWLAPLNNRSIDGNRTLRTRVSSLPVYSFRPMLAKSGQGICAQPLLLNLAVS